MILILFLVAFPEFAGNSPDSWMETFLVNERGYSICFIFKPCLVHLAQGCLSLYSISALSQPVLTDSVRARLITGTESWNANHIKNKVFSWQGLTTGAKWGHQAEILLSSEGGKVTRSFWERRTESCSPTGAVGSLKLELFFNIWKGPEEIQTSLVKRLIQ